MVFANPLLRTARLRGRCSMRQGLACWLALSVLALATPTQAETKKDKGPELPRLGLDPADPQVRSAPPAIPFGIPPATSKEYVFDFHGYMLLPLRIGIAEREDPAPGQGETVLHTP